ncbi:MAG: DarT ssDNA thymidine ADP-ribosyltransferase family protein [Bacteroidales bacterium]|nr:DarT ssDNA thymidine ADP-ribosyltransferase family protein [Bacteroidales bacterium]
MKRTNWRSYKHILDRYNITKLYHFTDRDNLDSIIKCGGLYSWKACEDRGITIKKSVRSRDTRILDNQKSLQYRVRLGFSANHPMMFQSMLDMRISNPVVLEIDPAVIFESSTMYSDRDCADRNAQIGNTLDDFVRIHFQSVTKPTVYGVDEDEEDYYQAEVLVNDFIPLKYITNIANFGIPIPTNPLEFKSKEPYTSQITRNTPTAFIFLVDQSMSMKYMTTFNGEKMTLAEAVAQVVNNQINELVLRCVKASEVRHYYDIALIGYGTEAYSGWSGELEGRGFVTPQELKDNPFKRVLVREEKRTRKGIEEKEVEKVQWLEARYDGKWTHLHKAFAMARDILSEWMLEHHDKDCYPPTIINITDGEFNGRSKANMLQIANELKSMFTNDGNVLLFNIHLNSKVENKIVFPVTTDELRKSEHGKALFAMSSLLPLRYNTDISKVRQDIFKSDKRHVAMAVNVDASTLIQLMDIGTPTNIGQSL